MPSSGGKHGMPAWDGYDKHDDGNVVMENDHRKRAIARSWQQHAAGRSLDELRAEQAYYCVADQAQKWEKVPLKKVKSFAQGNTSFMENCISSLIVKIYFGMHVVPGYTGLFDMVSKPEMTAIVTDAIDRVQHDADTA